MKYFQSGLFLKATACICAGALIFACTGTLQPVPQASLSPEGLQRVRSYQFDEVWILPGARLATYPEIAMETGVNFREPDEQAQPRLTRARGEMIAFPIPVDEQQQIEELFALRLARALDESSRYRRASAPGEGVLLLRVRLDDFIVKAPPEAPFSLTPSYIYSVGSATLSLELWDTERNVLMVRAVDHMETGPASPDLVRSNQAITHSQIRWQIDRWTRDVGELLDHVYLAYR